jgi:hypothetical protein
MEFNAKTGKYDELKDASYKEPSGIEDCVM